MMSTSSTADGARFIGRVGALAVALGIGAALGNSAAIATADTGGSDSSASSHSASTHSSSSRTGPRKGAQKDTEHRADRVKSKLAGKTTDRPDAAEPAAKVSASKVKKRRSATSEQAAAHTEKADQSSRSATPVTGQRAVTRTVTATSHTDKPAAEEPVATPQAEAVEPASTTAATTAVEPVATQVFTPTPKATRLAPAAAAPRPGLLSTVLSLEGLAPRSPKAPNPIENIALWTALGWTRRQSQLVTSSSVASTSPAAVQATAVQSTTTSASQTTDSTLATEEQLAAEQQVRQIVNTPVVQLAKAVLKVAWYVQAMKNFATVGGPDAANLAQLNKAADEYANQSATEFLLLNSNDPKLLLQVNPPHSWYGQDAGGTRVWYDNPDTVYRFSGVNAASEYVIRGHIEPGTDPTDTNISVLTGITGTTAANLSGKDIVVDENGDFVITVSARPAEDGETNHLQLPSNATILTTRNTMSDWDTQQPMTLTIERVSGPPESLFGQIGGFAIPGIGPAVVENSALLNLVSLIPAFDKAPLLLSSTETALLMLVTGISGENTYMQVATTDPVTGELREPNTLSEPAHNAAFLSTQLQSAGYFQLADDEAMIVTIDPGTATYFSVPVYNDWTITDNYWDQQTSLNNGQAIQNLDENGNPDGTYTVVISKNDPGVANWVSTGGLNQGTISIRFQGVDPDSSDAPTVTTTVVKLDDVKDNVQDNQDVYDREQQIADRQAGYYKRYTV
ncbi:hypothetical protein FR943_03395 [Mycobacterium sp. TNTM28]|uniref:DUF1214 domain-containing protein n=1 Tax=[Mycobacterium] fortunisiensis TaxID=2600579 RepID=A0ABS6KH64_9MYCO|nr:DUF1214 domain-containing protein [[Mycobacterium] fortunisiensis]MBU9762902.1 hypothetical protein [[Mycobacterium] fortunisiensis]